MDSNKQALKEKMLESIEKNRELLNDKKYY